MVTTAEAGGALEREREALPGRANASARFRVPEGSSISAMLAAGKLPEDKLKDSIFLALTRMSKEGKLSVKDPVADIMKRLFPSAGKFDQTEFEKVIDVKDRSKIYKSVADAESKVNSTDKVKLGAAMDDAAKLIDGAMADGTGLTEVFGSKASAAKAIYGNAKKAMANAKSKMDTAIDTDYNRDDEQVGLGGWANFGSQHIHLERAIAEVTDADESKITLIHECSHLANSTVDDRGYYGSDGFEGMSEDEKLGNAAHYEELPRRALGKSKYAGVTFTPGKTKSGGAVTFQDEIKRGASEYLRKAWDKAVDVHAFLRGIRLEIEGGNHAGFNAKKARILELSKLEHLTIHEQSPAETINMNDVVLAEGVARATVIIQGNAAKQAIPSSLPSGKTKQEVVDDVIAGAIKGYGALTGNDADDKKLMDWLVKEYRKNF